MKIFANNFALVLRLREQHPNFKFARHSLAAVVNDLHDGGSAHGRSFFIDPIPGEDFLKLVVDLCREPEIASRQAELNLMFDSEQGIAAFSQAFQAQFHPVAAAGGLIVGPGPCLLMMERDGKTDLPKGKVEKGEGLAAAAWREVEEETGLKNHVLGEFAANTWHIYQRKGRWDFKTTHWFWMQCTEKEDLVPQNAEGITEVSWVPIAELRKNLPETYPQIVDLVRLTLSHLPV